MTHTSWIWTRHRPPLQCNISTVTKTRMRVDCKKIPDFSAQGNVLHHKPHPYKTTHQQHLLQWHRHQQQEEEGHPASQRNLNSLPFRILLTFATSPLHTSWNKSHSDDSSDVSLARYTMDGVTQPAKAVAPVAVLNRPQLCTCAICAPPLKCWNLQMGRKSLITSDTFTLPYQIHTYYALGWGARWLLLELAGCLPGQPCRHAKRSRAESARVMDRRRSCKNRDRTGGWLSSGSPSVR